MGAGASTQLPAPAPFSDEAVAAPITVYLKGLPAAIEEAVYVHEKFPVIIDEFDLASKFLKYQLGSFLTFEDPHMMNIRNLNRCLVGSMLHGRTLTLKMKGLEGVTEENLFKKGEFPVELLSKEAFFREEVYRSVVKPELGDDKPEDCSISAQFVFILTTGSSYVPEELSKLMHVIRVIEKPGAEAGGGGEYSAGDKSMDEIAGLYGACEVVRNSPQLVEAAFDGELADLRGWMEKGYHVESVDGRKNTALSEAASQGHMFVVRYLLDEGADPNKPNDTNRTPLWRAAFNGHKEVVVELLHAGAHPDCQDKVSMESAFDVSKTEEIRELIRGWDRVRAERLIEDRKRVILARVDERIKTSVEREALARQKLRIELVDFATKGDVSGIKETLQMIAEEAEKTGMKPRVTAECRNDLGQSLLSIAAQRDDEPLARFLLTHYKECDKDRWDLAEGESGMEAKVFKTNVNSRDLKGWSCACIAVFHDSKKVLALLLQEGADPLIRSSYNKHAYDLAKDEVDAAEHVIRSRADIRQVLADNDRGASSKLFGAMRRKEKEDGDEEKQLLAELGPDGSPVELQREMQKAVRGKAAAGGAKKKTKEAARRK